MKAVSKFGIVSVTKKHCSASLVQESELQAQIPQESYDFTFVVNCNSYNVFSGV
jgi:hypothetical protein